MNYPWWLSHLMLFPGTNIISKTCGAHTATVLFIIIDRRLVGVRWCLPVALIFLSIAIYMTTAQSYACTFISLLLILSFFLFFFCWKWIFFVQYILITASPSATPIWSSPLSQQSKSIPFTFNSYFWMLQVFFFYFEFKFFTGSKTCIYFILWVLI